MTGVQTCALPIYEIKPEGGTKLLYGNRFANVEFKNPQGAPTIRHPFRVRMDDSQPVPIRFAFAWMTASRFQSDRKVSYPFQDTLSLDHWLKSNEHSTKENSP